MEPNNRNVHALAADLPTDIAARFNGELAGKVPIGHAVFDVDAQNRFAAQAVVLTETELMVAAAEGMNVIPLASIEEAKIAEGLGVDRLELFGAEKVLITTLRYTRKQRRDMTRLHRKLNRRLKPKEGAESERNQEWLEAIEKQTEQLDRCPKCGQSIPSYADGVCPVCLRGRSVLWRMMDVAKPYKARIRVALFATLCVAAGQSVGPWIMGHIVDDGLKGLNKHSLLVWSVLLIFSILFTEGLNGIRMYILATVGTRLTADLRHKVYAHMHELSLRFFAKRRTGSLITRVTNDTDRLWDFVVFGSIDFVRNVLMVVIMATFMFIMSWRLALIALIPIPIVGTLTYFRTRKMHKLWGRLWTYWSRMGAVVGDAIPGVKVVKAFANEGREIARFDARSEEYTKKEQEIHRAWTTLGPVANTAMRLGGVLVWLVGGYLVINHGDVKPYTVGTLIAFAGYISMFYGPINELVNSNRMVTRAATSAQRVFEVLDTPPEIYSQTKSVTKEKLEGRIEFRNVFFSYEGAQPALRDVSLTVEPGQMIGLCGPSGAGKSTFVNLLCRFYDVTDGQILLDGVDIRDYDVRWLRRQIGLVLQEPYLFHGTVADNIRYGNPDVTQSQIIEAARAANAHNFVVGFPDGYDTMVGERGQSLSGGERQRISIARAILHNPRLLILDEATSSVDTETEKQIQQALDRLVEGRTTIAIAHRLSTLRAASKLVVLDKGKVAEEGTHDELVEKPDGVYAKLHKTQAEMNAYMAIR